MPRPRLIQDDQLALDETVVEDEVVEHALLHRQDRKAAMGQLRKEYQAAHEAAKVAIERLELPDGGAVRVGKFRIQRIERGPRSVAFETQPTTQLKIDYVGEDE